MIIIMTMPCYKRREFDDGGLLQRWQVNDNKSNKNNEDKILFASKKMKLVSHMLNHMLITCWIKY